MFCLSCSGPQTYSRRFSSRIPSVSSFRHRCSKMFSDPSYNLTDITPLNTLSNHSKSKITNLFSSGVSSKWIKILWSCKKLIALWNCFSSLMLHSSNASSLASSRETNLWPSSFFFWIAFSNINDWIGIVSLSCGNSLHTASTSFRKRTISEHSNSWPDFVVSTTKKSLYKWTPLGVCFKDP